ncbi:hypothetical protein PoB_002759800 [Plakobranchus ocellatus]|uniref:Uncharacterized protein n=1 Tax=Plakobranchus ocellatus TaxID=259542 RepID=A0AAV4A364_9GAST|nr:hypothetical protein PoB_002759800 [Plakobranchus ocellatus]
MRRYAPSTRSYLLINTLFHLMAVQIQLWKVARNNRKRSVNSSFLYRPQILDLDKTYPANTGEITVLDNGEVSEEAPWV